MSAETHAALQRAIEAHVLDEYGEDEYGEEAVAPLLGDWTLVVHAPDLQGENGYVTEDSRYPVGLPEHIAEGLHYRALSISGYGWARRA